MKRPQFPPEASRVKVNGLPSFRARGRRIHGRRAGLFAGAMLELAVFLFMVLPGGRGGTPD